MSTSSDCSSADGGRWIIAQYAGVWPSTDFSCSIEARETCCRSQAMTQLSNIPNAASRPSDHNEAPTDEEGLVTRSRTRLSTVMRTSACDFGVGGSLDFDEEVPRMFRYQDGVGEEIAGDCGFHTEELGPGDSDAFRRSELRKKGRFESVPSTGAWPECQS